MRIVAVADTHLCHEGLSVPAGDVFVHAGDLCRSVDARGRERHLAELASAVDWIRSLPHPSKIVIAGNHDWAFMTDPQAARALCGRDIVYLEDAGASVGGVRFWGSPWQPEFNRWAFNLPRGEALAAKWALIPEGTDVLLTHGPPLGFGDRTRSGHKGCADLLARVRALRPPLHLFGHIHEDGGAWLSDGTLFANVSTWEGERGATVFDFHPGMRAGSPVHVPPSGRY